MISKQELLNTGMSVEGQVGKIIHLLDIGVRRGNFQFVFPANQLPHHVEPFLFTYLVSKGWTPSFSRFTDYPDADYTSRGSAVPSVRLTLE